MVLMTKHALRSLARASEAARYPNELGPPAEIPPDANGYRHYAIPGSGLERWDPDLHGVQLREEELGADTRAAVAWLPGSYSFSTGSGDSGFVIQVTGEDRLRAADPRVLEGFHEFLRVAMPPE